MKSAIYDGSLTEGPVQERNYYNSRKALLSILKEFGPWTMHDLEIKRHLHLIRDPKIKVSLSHTKQYGAAACSNAPDILSVGIDLELSNRQMKDGSEKYFVNDMDPKEDSLKLWVKKEAAFKALSPLVKKKYPNLLLKQIWVTDDSFGIYPQKKVLGSLKLEIIEEFNEKFYKATSWIKAPFSLE